MSIFGTLKNNVTQGLDVVKQLLLLTDKVDAISKRVKELEDTHWHKAANDRLARQLKWSEKDKK